MKLLLDSSVPKHPGAALLDAGIAVNAVGIGALLVSTNADDFRRLGLVLAVRFEPWKDFRSRLTGG